mmetsp:Transcript_22562/g.52269  ORF Transcript_22562/g.52269 Transcript_22562/m.52269 type:complete len:209 (-) Transcript_22562:8120-8746(-)
MSCTSDEGSCNDQCTTSTMPSPSTVTAKPAPTRTASNAELAVLLPVIVEYVDRDLNDVNDADGSRAMRLGVLNSTAPGMPPPLPIPPPLPPLTPPRTPPHNSGSKRARWPEAPVMYLVCFTSVAPSVAARPSTDTSAGGGGGSGSEIPTGPAIASVEKSVDLFVDTKGTGSADGVLRDGDGDDILEGDPPRWRRACGRRNSCIGHWPK